MKRLFLAVAAVVMLLIGLRYAIHGGLGISEAPQLAAASRILPVETATVHSQDEYQVKRFYTGTVRARRSSDVGFEHGGRVVSMLVQEGQRVYAGQALATLDTRRLEAQQKELLARKAQAIALLDELVAGPRPEEIEQSRSRVKDLEEQLELSRIKRSRAERLVAEHVVAEEALEEAASTEEQLSARLHAAREELQQLLAGTREERIRAQEGVVHQLDAALELAGLNIDNGVVRAPFDGIVSQRLIDEGSVIAAGEAVLKIMEDARPEAWIGVPADMAGSILPGKRYAVEVGGRDLLAVALFLLPEMDASTRTVTAVFGLDTESVSVIPGQVVRLSLTKTLKERGMWIPTKALTRGVHGLWNCYAVVNTGEAGRVEHRQVQVLYAEGDRLYVRGTLRDGDLIVTEGTHRLVTGQLVKPLEAQS